MLINLTLFSSHFFFVSVCNIVLSLVLVLWYALFCNVKHFNKKKIKNNNNIYMYQDTGQEKKNRPQLACLKKELLTVLTIPS